MNIKVLLLLVLVSLFACKEEENSSPNVSDEQLNQIGNKLAEWGNSNCKVIAIDGTNILWQGPNAGGCSKVYFEFTGTFDPLNFEDEVQRNLRELINKSNCELTNLIADVNNIESNSTEQQVNQYLDCIGTVAIFEGAFGTE